MSQSAQFPTVTKASAKGIDRHRVRSLLALATPVALVFLVSACGESTTTPPAAEPSSAATESSPSGDAGSVLTGTVGAEGEPDAFKITLMDSTGAAVTTLKAGDYTVNIKDLSKIHNFKLTGTDVDEKTSVPDVEEATWKVKLVAGTYTYVCGPHPKMTGSFTVT